MAVGVSVILLAVAVAIDIGSMQSEHRKLQNSLDTAVLSSASNYMLKGYIKSDEFTELFLSNLDIDNVTNLEIQNPKKVNDEYVIAGEASYTRKNMLMNIFGKDDNLVKVYSKANIKISSISTAVVSDISWSMRGDNMRSMQKAMITFGDEMFDIPSEFKSRLRMSTVPFAGSVNISDAYRDSSSLLRSWEFSSGINTVRNKKSFYQNSGACNPTNFKHEEIIRGNNVELVRHAWEWTRVGQRRESFTNGSGRVQYRNVPVHDWRCVNKGVVERYPWSGCIQMDDSQVRRDFRLNDGSHIPYPTTISSGSAPHCPSSNTKMQTDIKSASQYRRHVQNLEVGFGTSHDIGLLWANWLLDPARASDFGLSPREWDKAEMPKYVIFLSDGKAKNVGYDFNPMNNRTEDGINRNTQEICDDLKSKNVIVYGISYVRASAPDAIKNVEQCATKGYHYKGTKDDIEGIFKDISKDIKLKSIRVSR